MNIDNPKFYQIRDKRTDEFCSFTAYGEHFRDSRSKARVWTSLPAARATLKYFSESFDGINTDDYEIVEYVYTLETTRVYGGTK